MVSMRFFINLSHSHPNKQCPFSLNNLRQHLHGLDPQAPRRLGQAKQRQAGVDSNAALLQTSDQCLSLDCSRASSPACSPSHAYITVRRSELRSRDSLGSQHSTWSKESSWAASRNLARIFTLGWKEVGSTKDLAAG